MLRNLRSARSKFRWETFHHYSAGYVFLIMSILLLLGSLALPFSTHYGMTVHPLLDQEEVIAQIELAEEATIGTNEFLTYENGTYGIRVMYPADWAYFGNVETGGFIDIVLFQAPFEGRTDPSSAQFIVSMDTLPSDRTMSLAGYANEIINNNKLSNPTYNVLESITDGSITLLGKPAYRVTSTYILDNTTYATMEIGTFVDGKVYVITYDADQAEFYEYQPIAQQMINSFEVLGLSGYTTIEGSSASSTNLVNMTSGENGTIGSSNITDTAMTMAN